MLGIFLIVVILACVFLTGRLIVEVRELKKRVKSLYRYYANETTTRPLEDE